MKPRKRNKSKRHKNNKTEEILKTHQIVIGYGTLSEIIVDKMITKIISLVISKSLTKKLYSDESVGTCCMNYTKRLIFPLIQIASLSHDTDDLEQENQYWVSVSEPDKITVDRDAFTFIHIDNFKEEQGINDINEIKANRRVTKILEINKKEFGSSRNVVEIPDKESTLSNKSGMETFTVKKGDKSYSSKRSIKLKPSDFNVNENKGKRDRPKIIDLPSFEIKDLLGNKESEEVKKLRMEKEKILLQKKQKQMQEELKKQQLKERPLVYAYNSDKSNSTIEIIPNKFDLSKYTFDSEGKLIPYKFVSPGNFVNEFYEIQSNNKLVKQITPKIEINEEIYREATSKTSGVEVISNRNESETTERPLGLTKNSEILKYVKVQGGISKENYCQPSGDNFQMINPETGVIVKYDNPEKTKIGNMSFLKKYNKYSSTDFTTVLNETLSKNNQFINKSMIDIHDEKLSKQDELSDRNNCSLSMSKIFTNSQNIKDNQSLSNSSFANKNFHGMTKSMSMSKIILSSHINCSNLMETFDTNEHLPEINSKKNQNKNLKNIFHDFFSKKYYLNKQREDKANTQREKKLRRNKSLEMINQFNTSIIQHKGFGFDKSQNVLQPISVKNNDNKPFFKIPFKPDPYEMIRQNGIMLKPIKSLRVNYSCKVPI